MLWVGTTNIEREWKKVDLFSLDKRLSLRFELRTKESQNQPCEECGVKVRVGHAISLAERVHRSHCTNVIHVDDNVSVSMKKKNIEVLESESQLTSRFMC